MLRIFFGYICYRLFAPHRKGFGVHSPFVYHLITNVLLKYDDERLKEIRQWRNLLAKNNERIKTAGTGAGSKIHMDKLRSVRGIIKHSSVTHKYGRILYYVSREYNPETIIELGTGLGISTAYLINACPGARIMTLDADRLKMDFAENALKKFKTPGIQFCNGSFEDLLLSKLRYVQHPLLVFIDGDHKLASVMGIFEQILQFARQDTIIILDDISWSREMRKAWKLIKKDPRSVLCIDLFFMGLIFFRDGMVKQNYVINL